MNQNPKKIMIYGANGYMGKLFTKYARELNYTLVLASRDEMNTEFEHRKFTLEKIDDVQKNLTDIQLLINLAGPFEKTQKSLINACLKTGTHYIDISGEVSEFKSAFQFDEEAKKSNIMILPGAGFGVVPTSIAAHLAHKKLPNADELIISYSTKGAVSRGTLKTVLKDINKSGIEIANGNEVLAEPAKSSHEIIFEKKKQRLVYNPWRADLFSSHITSQIPSIQTYSNFPKIVEKMMHGNFLWLRNILLNRLITLLPVGPSEKQLKKGKTFVQAEVKNKNGQAATIQIIGPEAYIFTAQTLTSIAKRIMEDKWVKGFQTPIIYKEEILLEFKNVEIINHKNDSN